MVDMLSATRAYEANITAFNAARNMARSALSIGQR
jgi:flagellar basal-body rod protein FlgC